MNQDIQEEWRDIKDYENLYAVSDKGRVMNLKSGRILKAGVNSHCYEWVALCKDGKVKQCTIHRLVAEAFLENPNNLPQVNHVDEDPTNNDVRNLAWVTASQNNRHSAHKRSCKISQYSIDGEYIREWESFKEIERELGFNKGFINMCCKGKQKTAYGYRWEYADPSQQRKFNRPIVVMTKDDDFIAEFRNINEASICLGIYVGNIWFALNGIYKTSGGFKFQYLDELSQEIKNEDEKLNNDAQIDNFN